MDAKDLRTESALSERNNDNIKYSQSGGIALHCERNKSYQDVGSNSLSKVDVQGARPCAVIGPDRVVPPTVSSESYFKKGPSEPWPCMDNTCLTRRPPDYPHKLTNFQNPTRNISPRQTFQENMQRIMVPPSYNSAKISDDINYTQMTERSNALPKNGKINVPSESKFCDVPYTVYPNSNEQKNVRNPEMCLSSVNPTLTRTGPHGWPPGSVSVPTRAFGAPELYQYQDYSSCAGPRSVAPRPNRIGPEDPGFVYADPFYHQEGNIRFKPYPTAKERFVQQRYDYVTNYANTFHPPPAFPSHKYELQKSMPPHPYPPYTPVKYLDRVTEPIIEGYQRNQQGNFNVAYRNQIIHPNFGPVLGNCPQNKIHAYPSDGHMKSMASTKVPYENSKTYVEYENGRPKMYPPHESYLINEMGRMQPMKSQVIMPNYPPLNMHNLPTNHYFKKDNQQMKNYEYMQHFRSMDPNLNLHNPMVRHPPVYSPNTLAISPTDSSTSNDTSQTLGTSQEDCGYVSQSSNASVRSMDSGIAINRLPNEYFRKCYDNRYGPIIRTSPMMSRSELNSNNNSKEKKNIDVRQFLQMWNEGDEESEENIPKEIIIQTGPKGDSNFGKAHEVISQANQEQLYVLGLVNVPSEELGKYEHIQKVSKLPENIKGYNHIELLNQFEEAIESSNIASKQSYKTSSSKDFQTSSKVAAHKQGACAVPPRPLSPLDVEAKISQSVIHKEVGCNFEIKPCSPKMLNAEVATPVQNILTERVIEKVANPVMLKSPRLTSVDENIDCTIMKRKEHRMNINNEAIRIPSCKMINPQFSNNSGIDTIKNSYSLQDLESNSGLCLASLPRLDNDIELNFPEVNQQFINANRRDSTVLTSTLRDLPTLEALDQSDSQTKDKLNDMNSVTCENDSIKSPCVVDSEKEFLKLSKYRKTRVQISNFKENFHAIRTDSVIIKNPENVKNCDESSMLSPNPFIKQNNDIQKIPINLTSQVNIAENSDISSTPKHHEEMDSSIDIAIDFSLNRNVSSDNIACLDVKSEKETKILSDSTSEISNSILDEHLSELPTYSECEKNILNDPNNDDEGENVSQCPEKYSDKATEVKVANDSKKDDAKLIDNTPVEETLTKKGYTSTESRVNEPKAESICAKDLNDESDSLLPIDFVTPNPELLRTADNNDDDYFMDVEKKDSNANPDLGKANNTPITSPEAVVESQKNNNKVLSNINQHGSDETKNVIKSNLNIDVLKDSEIQQLLRPSEVTSPRPENTNCDHEEPTKKEPLESNTYKLESAEQSTLNFGLTALNDIVISSEDNRHTDIIDREISNTDLLSPKSQHYCESGKAKGQHDFNFDLHSNNIVSVDNVFLENKENEKKEIDSASENKEPGYFPTFNIPSPVTSIQDDSSETVNYGDSNFESITFNRTVIHNKGDSSSKTFELEIITDINTPSQNAYQLDHRPQNVDSNVDSIHPSINNGLTNKENNDEVNNMNVITEGLLDEESGYRTEVSSTESTNLLLHAIEKQPQTNHTIELNVEKEEVTYIHRNIRYLSYGSKVMYSPWIQKLIMFCEGKTSTVNIYNGNGAHDNCALTEDVPREVLDGFDHCVDRDNTAEQENAEGSTSPIVKNEINDMTNLSDSLVIKNHSEINPETNFKNEDNITELDKPCETFVNHGVPNIPHNIQYNNDDNINKTSQRSVNVNKDINNLENNCNKFDIFSKQVSCCISTEINEQLEKSSTCSDKITEQWNRQIKGNDEIPEQVVELSNFNNKTSNCDDCIPEIWDKLYKCNNDIFEELDRQHSIDKATLKKCDDQSYCNDTNAEYWDVNSSCSDEVQEKAVKRPKPNYGGNNCEIHMFKRNKESEDKQPIDGDKVPKQFDKQSNGNPEDFEENDKQSHCNDIELELSITEDSNEFSHSKVKSTERIFFNKNRQPIKRSLSDSALHVYNNNETLQSEMEENVGFIWPFKRRKMNNVDNDMLAQNLCNIIQSNRRNSISSIYNEENLSFCILIDNSCIITEEENDEQENICYTEEENNEQENICYTEEENNVQENICYTEEENNEQENICYTEEENDEQKNICYTKLSEECSTEVQSDCLKDEDNTEIISTLDHESKICEYSDSYIVQNDNEKLEESWVEDVACVETVISDDIAEDIEINGPSSPKDNGFSDNDESGVFSSSEHTDKVKYIYGDKMCNDDAHFVESLYNTPQMDVNKRLIQREALVSSEYYDNDSLEKILSECNDHEQSSHVLEYTAPIFSPRIIDTKQTIDNKENMNLEVLSPLDCIAKPDDENIKFGQFNKTQDDIVHSCESSVDNVFTYKESEENMKYITSSSPEVSSTTSEEKNSAILLKITSYKGSRISQIHDNSRDIKRPSCKFTEDKDYVQSLSTFPLTHRPLLTKAAQKYIPPLKESIRDLKVKLSLPQHSLLKLKQLKKSKDEPKVYKNQNISVPIISKKPKPKFEDVLKSIDEIQFKMHKEKTKKSKKSIPKVVIKKHENGSHYASTSNKNDFNPDLTGRKWQPWVFIEKNHFIDKMAIKKKSKAVYNHRKQTYVLSEKFQKYKSINSAKFVISPPLSDCPPTGLKYTIRLKHSY